MSWNTRTASERQRREIGAGVAQNWIVLAIGAGIVGHRGHIRQQTIGGERLDRHSQSRDHGQIIGVRAAHAAVRRLGERARQVCGRIRPGWRSRPNGTITGPSSRIACASLISGSLSRDTCAMISAKRRLPEGSSVYSSGAIVASIDAVSAASNEDCGSVKSRSS